MSDDDLMALAQHLAIEAGHAIMAIRAAGFSTAAKADQSPVTAADHAAEAIIVDGLRAHIADVLVVAEEEMAAGRVHEPQAEYWLVDPLDGTREFAAGRDEFTVNLGLIRHGRPALGVVYAPATGELFGGIAGAGAWKIPETGAADRRAITARRAPAGGVVVMTSRHSGRDPRMESWLADFSVAEHIRIGSSLKLCRVAEGAADLYPRFGRTMEWDTAAGQAVLEAAGGAVRTADGEPLRYGKPGWENPDFFCFGG